MASDKKRVIIASLIVIILILLASSLSVAIKLFPTYYDELTNLTFNFSHEELNCESNTSCSFVRYLELPSDYNAFGENSISLRGILKSDRWDQLPPILEGVGSRVGVTTNESEPDKIPDYFWTIDYSSTDVKMNNIFAFNLVDLSGMDIDYDYKRNTLWVLGEKNSKPYVYEYNITTYSKIREVLLNDPSAGSGEYIFTVYGDYFYARVVPSQNIIKKYDKTTGNIVSTLTLPTTSNGMKGIETVDGTEFWVSYYVYNAGYILHVDSSGNYINNITTGLSQYGLTTNLNGLGRSDSISKFWVYSSNKIYPFINVGFPSDVSLFIDTEEIYSKIGLFDANPTVLLKDGINNFINTNCAVGTCRIPFVFNIGNRGKIEYYNFGVYADNQSFPVKIVYPEPDTYHDTTLDVSIYVDTTPTSCVYEIEGVPTPIGIPILGGVISNITISPEDISSEGNISLSFDCPPLGSSDNVMVIYDKGYPSIDFDAYTKSIIGGSFGQVNIYFAVVGDDPTEKNTTFYLYDEHFGLKDTVSGKGMRFANLSVANQSGLYYFNVTMIDEFGRSNTTSLGNITVDSAPPFPVVQNLNTSALDMNYQTINISGYAYDDKYIANATTIITWPNGTQEYFIDGSQYYFIDCALDRKYCEFSLTKTPIHVAGNYTVQTVWVDKAGNDAYSNIDSFYVRDKASITSHMKPDGTIIVESQTGGSIFYINTTMKNTDEAGAYFSQITLSLPSGWTSNFTNDTVDCGTVFDECNVTFEITVPEDAPSTTSPFWAEFKFFNPDNIITTTTDSLNVKVTPNKATTILQNSLSNSSMHNVESYPIGSFTVKSVGNAIAGNIVTNYSGGDIPQGWLSFKRIPYFSYIGIGESRDVTVEASIPAGTPPGIYNTIVYLYSDGVYRDDLNLSVTILPDLNWTIMPVQIPPKSIPTGTSGFFDSFNVTNIGNVNLTFVASVRSETFTGTDLTVEPDIGITIEAQDSYEFDLHYSWDPTIPGGNYLANVTLIETTPPPTEKYTFINVTLLDTPPDFNSFEMLQYIEINEPLTTMLNITDNIDPEPDVWGNFTLPDGSTEDAVIQLNYDYVPPFYEITYVPYVPGIYILNVWADDGVQPPSNLSKSFEAINETFFSIFNSINNSYTVVEVITWGEGYLFEFNVSINNTGKVAGRIVIINSSYSDQLSNLEPQDYYLGSFGEYEDLPFNITVPLGTPPGIYPVTPAVHWRNPDMSYASNSTMFRIEVTSNKILSIPDEEIDKPILPNTIETVSFTVSSIGNDKLSNITLSCQEGIACYDFDIIFSDNNFDLNAGEEKQINMDIYVPYLYDAGTYQTIINASAEDDALYMFNITVPDDDRWQLSPVNISVNAGANSQGYAGKINIANMGNMAQLFFNLSVSDESALSLGNYSISVAKNSSTDVEVFYTAPGEVGNHTFNITIFNDEYIMPENSTEVIIKVINFSVSPISWLPNKDILPNDTIYIQAEADYEGIALDQNVSWSIKIADEYCPIINYSYNNTWDIYCSAPILADGLNYTLDLIGLFQNYSAEYTHTTPNAIHYKDTTPPTFTDNEETDVINGTNVSLSLNSSDNIDVLNAWVEVQYPDGTAINYSMEFENETFELDIPDLDVGDYDIIYYINDTGNNIVTSEDWFEVYIPINFSGDVIDSEDEPTNTTFKFYRPGTDYLLYEFNSTEDGYNITEGQIHRRDYDIDMTVPAVDIELFNVTVNETTVNPIDIEHVIGERVFIPLYKPLVGAGVLHNFTILGTEINDSNVNASVTIHYDGTIYGSKINIVILKCSDWNYDYAACDSAWVKLNSTNDVDANTVSIDIDSFSAYMAAEGRCGDYGCEATYGENLVTCPIDCKEGGSGTISTGGGGGGGISRSAMEELLKKYTNDTVNVTGDGFGINISKEIKAALESPTQIQGVKVATTSIYRELFPGEELSTGIILRNVVEDQTVTIKARTVGTIADFIEFDSDTVTLKPLQEMNFGISIVAEPFTMAGSYEGSIILESGGRSLQIPVSLRVQEKTEKLLDMKIQPLVDRIGPDEDLKLQIDIYNLGKTARVDVLLTYQLVDALTEEIITEKQESLAIETTLSQIRTLHIPADTRLGKYLVRGLSSYLSYNKTSFASSLAYVNVARPWYLYEMFGVIPMWIIFSVLLFVGLNAGMFFGYQQYQAKKKKYKIALDLKTLPQPGEKTAYIGHIAETSIRTFLEINKMQTHTIVAGSTGGGKTVAAQALVEEALRNNVGVIVFDPTAQWTGFLRPCKERRMLKYYPKFQMKQKQAQAFNGNIHNIEDARQIIDIKKFMKPGEINIFSINKLKLKEIDIFVANTVRQMFEANLDESPELRLLMVYDEVHRLLPKFGGTGEGFMQIERACREFRKWGVGLVLISQVLSDFIGSIKANINTEVQVRTRDEGDLDRIKTKYGEDVMRSIVKASVGTAMFQNSAYNKGRPYFVDFRPLLHSITRLSDDDLAKYQKFNEKVDDYEFQMDQLEQEKVDVFDLRLELKLALDKLKVGKFNMVNIYLEGIEPRLKKNWEKVGKEPKKREIKLAKVEEIQKSIKEAEKARKEFEKKEKGKGGAEKTEAAAPAVSAPVEEAAPSAPVKVKKVARVKQKSSAKPKVKKEAAEPQPKKIVDPVEQLEDKYKELKAKLSEKRKQGADTSMIEISMKSIPADIKMFAAIGKDKIKKKILKKMNSIEKKL